MLFLFVTGGEETQHLWKEGHVTEVVTEFGYLGAFFIFLKLALTEKRSYLRAWLWFWAFCSFVFYGEETSWLQHYLIYETPDIVEGMNRQHEFNLHNMVFVQSYSLRDGEFTLSDLLTAQHLFRMGFFSYFFILPLLNRIKPFNTLVQKYQIPVPGLNVMLFIWIPIFTTIALSVLSLSDPITKGAVAEAREMFYGFGVGIFAISGLIALRLNRPQ